MADPVAGGLHLRQGRCRGRGRVGGRRGRRGLLPSFARPERSRGARFDRRARRALRLRPSAFAQERATASSRSATTIGISSAIAGVRLDRAVGERALGLAVGARLSGAVGAFGFDHREHRSDRNLVADFARQLDHLAGDRAFHFDRRLVGHHVGDLLVLADHVADLDVPGDDLGLGNAFADVGQLELVEVPSVGHHFLECFFHAFRTREIGPFDRRAGRACPSR